MKINVSTRHWHAHVDEPWLDLLQPTGGRAEYLSQLGRVYGFVAPFESALKYTPGVGRALDFRQITRAGLIAQDLLGLGLSPSDLAKLPQCTITPFVSLAEALGWLYVIERSTLLHHGVRRHLVTRLPEVAAACAYLSQYDGRVNEHWSTLGTMLDRIGATDDVADTIIAAAHDAFDTAQRWFNARFEIRSVG